jgi:hypothetical protein
MFSEGLGRLTVATEISEEPPVARVKRYRGLASDARLEADAARGMARESLLVLAGQWDKIATDIEDHLKSVSVSIS